MWKSLTVLILFFTALFEVEAQKMIKGQIFEIETEEPITGATILESGIENPKGVLSDINGKFELKTTASVIQISFLGFENQTLQITKDTFLIILLKYSNNILEAPIIRHSELPGYKTPIELKSISKKELNLNNTTIIAPSLNRVAGVHMQSGALNTNRLTIRGIGSRSPFITSKIKIYLDDIPLTNGSGESTFEDIDLSILGKVDVLKGPTSSIYGAGLGGMLHLNTPQHQQPGTQFSLNGTVGSYNLRRSVLHFKHSKDGKNSVNINLNTTNRKGYRQNNWYSRSGFSTHGKFWLNDKEVVSVFGSYTYLYAQIPSSLDSTDYVNNPQKSDPNWNNINAYENYRKSIIGATYRSLIGSRFSQSSSIYNSFLNSYEKRPFNILREYSYLIGARSEWAYGPAFSSSNNKLEFRVGGEWFSERYTWLTRNTVGLGAPLSDNLEKRRQYNVFGQIKFDLKNITFFRAGVNFNSTRYYSYDYQIKRNSDRDFPSMWSPFLSISYKLSDAFGWKKNISLHAKIAHGFSPPTLEETLNPDGNINPDILPEQGWNFEFGSRGNIFHNLSYNFSIYSMQIKDLLVAKRVDDDQYIGINAGKTEHNGFELEVMQPVYFNSFNLRFLATYTFADYKFKEFIDDDEDHSGNLLTGTARHLFNAGVDASFRSFYGNIQYYAVGKMPMQDDNSVFSDAYNLMNTKVGYLLKIGEKWHLDIYAGINNLWNEKYASMIQVNAGSFNNNVPRYYYPGLPRNYYGGAKIIYDLK